MFGITFDIEEDIECKNYRCHKKLTDKEYEYSMKHFGKPLCIKHQPTRYAEKVGNWLINAGWDIEYEYFDGYKHVDIYVKEAEAYIEVDGYHHKTNYKQRSSDKKRDRYSKEDGITTIRIYNYEVKYDFEKTMREVDEILEEC